MLSIVNPILIKRNYTTYVEYQKLMQKERLLKLYKQTKQKKYKIAYYKV